MSHQDAIRLPRAFDFVSPCAYLRFEPCPEPMRGAELRPELFNHLADPSAFDEAKMRRIAVPPIGAARKP